MLDDYSKLKARTLGLGNHHRKYLHYITTHKDRLIERLEQTGRIDEVHLWSAAPDADTETAIVSEAGEDIDEKLSFLGCYFAFQLLNLNLRAVDVLRLGLSARADRYRLYRDFMLQMGIDLRRLCGAYMGRLLDLFLPVEERPEFVICGVGTRADQDDLDLGLVDDGSDRRAAFNRAIGRMQREMLRRAIPLHFHLSEHVGEQSFSASIAEYRALLDREIQDFIIITEMIGARLILGSRDLFERFTREVTGRYNYRPGGDNRFHEGYLRGMLGEVRSLLLWELRRNSVNPKRDALRIIKGIIAAKKTVFGIEETNAWDVLGRLATRDHTRRQVYEELDKALSFIEVFRFLYQLVEVQEEGILLAEDGSRARLESVAELMGYEDVGVVRAYDHLLIHYHEHVQRARELAAVLMADLRQHLEEISVFSELLRSRRTLKPAAVENDNLALRFVTALHFFRGTKYWDDVMVPMETDDAQLLRQFVDGFNSLPDHERTIWVQRYAKWGEVTILAVFRLLVLLYKRRHVVDGMPLFHELAAAFIDLISKSPDVVSRLTAVFHHDPQLINDLLLALKPEEKIRFTRIMEGQIWSEEVEVLRRQLLRFCQLHLYSSHYFKRFLERLVNRYPEYIESLDQPERLKVVAKGILARIDNLRSFEQKREELGSYYDLEFLRVGLQCMDGAPSEETNTEFTEFSDNYLQTLFDVCRQEVKQAEKDPVRTRDLLALFSAGGHGRKLAFDDDYDLIILLNSDDPEIRAYSTRIITRMNREIVRRGTMPHYRFADHFGEYVTTFSQLKSLFESDDEHVFIDMSQLMGARKLVGSSKFSEDLWHDIVQPLVIARKEQFVRQVATEIRSRRSAFASGIVSAMDVKETRGGLRDIELLLLVLMIKAELWQPVSHELLPHLLACYPGRARDLQRIFDAFHYLKRRRDIYRLTVAAEDDMLPDETGHMAKVLGYCDDPDDERGRQRLVDEFLATTAEVAGIVDSALDELGL